MTPQNKKAFSTNIKVGGISVASIATAIVLVTSVYGQVKINTSDISTIKNENGADHKVINASLKQMEIESNTIKTLQSERHKNITKKIDALDAKLDKIMDKLAKRG